MKKTAKLAIMASCIFIIICAVFGISASAESRIAVASSGFQTHQGESFTTTLYIPDDADIVDFDITLNYDTELLTLDSIEENEDIKGTVVFNSANAGEISVNYTRTKSNVTKYLPLIDITFTVDENIGIGSYDCFTIDENSTYIAHRLNDSGKLDTVDFDCDFAKLVIYEMGDIDLSEDVNIADATYLRRHLAEFDDAILPEFNLTLADVFYDGIIDIADPICLQRRLAKMEVLYGNRVNVTFCDINGEKYAAKSVVYNGTLNSIPIVPVAEGYADGRWSQSKDEYIEPVYTKLKDDMTLYAYYNEHIDQAMEYYKKVLNRQYNTGELSLNPNDNKLALWDTIYYQEGQYATLIWNSDSNYILNSTTGAFNKPTYPQDLKLTAYITSYTSGNRIDAEDTITFDYDVPGIYITPRKADVADFLRYYMTDDSDGKYRINYDVKLISKVNNTVLPVDGALYDNFEIRFNWYQDVDGTLTPISHVKRKTIPQVNDYVAVATFNGKPLEDDGKIYFDDVEVTAIDQMEIKNYIINQISNTGTLATDDRELWNNDTVYGTTVTWETGNADIAYVTNNVIRLKDDAITGSTLPLNAHVSYEVDGGSEEFVLSYNLTVSCDNTIIKAPENMDPELYRAIKAELEENLGYRGDLTSAALANVKFVNLDLSDYPEITSFRGLSYCKNLRTLNMSGIHITDGTMNQIATLSYLEAFVARGCGLDNLTDGGTATLRNAVGLKMIDLTDNNFTSLDSVFAEGVRYGKLREVYLSKNRLTDINALSRAPMMTYLSLSENGLTTEGSASIENYPYLQYLSLANNNIDSVEHLKNLKYLKELRLQNNNISNVNDLRKLVNLEILYLGHNKIKDVGNLNSLTRLQVFYINDNQIFDISNLRDLTDLEVVNVSNNDLTSLSVLNYFKSTLTEIYAENNKLTDFSFINGAPNLHILMLAGNNTEMVQENMNTWLSNLSEMEILTLSDIQLADLSFLDSMTKLVRLDVANCGLHAISDDVSNVQEISERYETLKILNINDNDFSDNEDEILKLRNIPRLVVLYADNICNHLDASTLTYSMTELRWISLENCGITSMNWLHKFNSLEYVDLAGNDITDVNLEAALSNASIKTIKELYLDTNVPCSFSNAFRVMDFDVERLSLEGVSIENVERMPNLEKIKYLNLSNTGLKNLNGADPEMADLYSVERYTTLDTIDVSGLEADISPIENIASVKTVYAVDTVDGELFHEDNLHALQRLYNKGVTCYLYDKSTEYVPTATKEGVDILDLIPDFSCDITVAAEGAICDDNPELINEINDFDIIWTLSNDENYEVVDNHIAVKDYAGIEDEELTVTATITVYPDQAPVSRDFTVNTHILRASSKYYEIDATGYSEHLTRDSQFNYNLTLKAAQTDGFSEPVKPVEDAITYEYYAFKADGEDMPRYQVSLTVGENNSFAIASTAPLNGSVLITIDVSHITKSGEEVFDIDTINVPITIASRTFTATFVMNGGTIMDANGLEFTSRQFVEDDHILSGLTYSRPGYLFKGWFLDEEFKTEFSNEGYQCGPDESALDYIKEAIMPAHDITIYAKWEAVSYNISFDANEGEVDTTSMSALSDVAIGELPVPTRQYYTFDGWFTEKDGGVLVTAESKFARTDDLTLYAHWTLNSFIVNLQVNGDGATVDASSVRGYCGQKLGDLPTPTRPYYTFSGWWTEISGGSEVTSETVYTTAVDRTVYAHWMINPTSDWVLADQMPDDAMLTDVKWTYTEREYSTGSSPTKDGWIKYDEKITSYKSEVGPVYSNPGGNGRKVRSEQYISGYNKKHVWKFYKYGYSPMDYSYRGEGGGRTKYDVYLDYYPSYEGQRPVDKSGSTFRWWDGNNWAAVYYESEWDEDNHNSPIYSTRWYYQDPIYTYYFYRDVDKESTSDPTGQENVSNIQKWVRYINKTETGSVWSAWSTERQNLGGNIVQEETATGYRYYGYVCPECGHRDPYKGACSNCSYTLTEDHFQTTYYPAIGSSIHAGSADGSSRGYAILDGEKWVYEYPDTNNNVGGTGQPTATIYRYLIVSDNSET